VTDRPAYSTSQRVGEEGVRLLGLAVGRGLGWVVRDQPTSDFGIDAHVEVIKDGLATGKLIAVQVKCGSSWFRSPVAGGWRFNADAKHLNYWREHSLPVLVVLCRPDDNACFWASVSPSSTSRLPPGPTIIVPSGNRFDEASRTALTELGHARSTIPLSHLVRSFLSDKYGSRIQVASIIESPRDWHYFDELAMFDQRTWAIWILEAQERPLDDELVQDASTWLAYNDRQVGGDLEGVMLYLVARTPAALPSVAEIRRVQCAEPRLQVTRILLTDGDLEEIDDDGYALMWFASTGESMRDRRILEAEPS
jgi:hypothetical protein